MKSNEIKNNEIKNNGTKSSFPDGSRYTDLSNSFSECSDSHSKSGIRIYGNEKPVRLFVAGLHGEEWKDTTELLHSIKPPKTGTLALIPLVSSGNYISTLDPAYYPGLGKKILEAIEELKPEIYIELHSYSRENLEKLSGKDRFEKIGVPAYSVLKDGVLLGSVSPWVRRKYFPKEALCLSFELQKENIESRTFTASILEVLKESQSRDEFIEYLKTEFPEQAKKAIEDYRKFYGDI